VDDEGWLIENFEANQERLRSVAYRMLGSGAEAEEAVQDAWIRLRRADARDIENFPGWLTTIVARVCLDRLRWRRARPENPTSGRVADLRTRSAEELDPQDQVLMAESVGSALLVVLDLLAPSERVAFVLHDIFAVPFDEIGPIIGRSTDASRQLASRARRRLREDPAAPRVDLPRQREVVGAFLAASQHGDFEALLALLDPEVRFRADPVARAMRGVPDDKRGARTVAGDFAGRAQGAQLALIDGLAGLMWAPGGKPRGVFMFQVADSRIWQITLVVDPERIAQLDIVALAN
jgi:RNA polymerase sigma-70 factor (ECF subfamily)